MKGDSEGSRWSDHLRGGVIALAIAGVGFWLNSAREDEKDKRSRDEAERSLVDDTRTPLRINKDYNMLENCFDLQAYNPSSSTKRGRMVKFFAASDKTELAIGYISLDEPSDVNVKQVLLESNYGTHKKRIGSGSWVQAWEGPLDLELRPDSHYTIRTYIVHPNIKAPGYIKGDLEVSFDHANGETTVDRVSDIYVYAVADERSLSDVRKTSE